MIMWILLAVIIFRIFILIIKLCDLGILLEIIIFRIFVLIIKLCDFESHNFIIKTKILNIIIANSIHRIIQPNSKRIF